MNLALDYEFGEVLIESLLDSLAILCEFVIGTVVLVAIAEHGLDIFDKTFEIRVKHEI